MRIIFITRLEIWFVHNKDKRIRDNNKLKRGIKWSIRLMHGEWPTRLTVGGLAGRWEGGHGHDPRVAHLQASVPTRRSLKMRQASWLTASSKFSAARL